MRKPIAILCWALGLGLLSPACARRPAEGSSATPAGAPSRPQPGAQGDKMTDQQILAEVKKQLAEKGVAQAAALEYSDGPIYDTSLPLRFFVGNRPAGGPPVPTTVLACAFDVKARRVYYKDASGFGVLLKGIGFPERAGVMTEADLFSAWYVMSFGAAPNIAYGPTGVGDANVSKLIKPPTLEKDKDATVLTAWTADRGGWALARHRLTLRAGGQFTADSKTGEEIAKTGP